MTCQLSKIGNLLKSAENKHDQTAEQLGKPFGPTWDRVLISFRDPPPNMFSLPSDSTIPLLLIAAGSGLGTWFKLYNFLLVFTLNLGRNIGFANRIKPFFQTWYQSEAMF